MNIQTRQYADEIFRPKDDTDESQLWLIAGLDAGLETVMIYNKVNGALLAANKSRGPSSLRRSCHLYVGYR